MKKTICVLLSFALCLCLIAGCGQTGNNESKPDQGSSTAKTEPVAPTQNETTDSKLKADIVFWSSYSESSNYGEVTKAAAEAFMKENPGVLRRMTLLPVNTMLRRG